MRFSLAILLFLLAGCSQAPPVIDNSQQLNSGVNIVPQAVVASMKQSPSTQMTGPDQLDVIEVITDSEQKHDVWLKLLKAADLVKTLQEQGPFTVLAPTDAAFDELPPGVIDRLLLPSHHAQLVALVRYHLLAGRIDATELQQTNGHLPTLEGKDIIIRGIGERAMINDANVIRSDATAVNGVVHWIDTVLLPG